MESLFPDLTHSHPSQRVYDPGPEQARAALSRPGAGAGGTAGLPATCVDFSSLAIPGRRPRSARPRLSGDSKLPALTFGICRKRGNAILLLENTETPGLSDSLGNERAKEARRCRPCPRAGREVIKVLAVASGGLSFIYRFRFF